MEWLDRMQEALAYIEDNLQGEIDWNEAGRRALCPGPMFARMFAVMVDIPLSEYIRRRRLTMAAFDLQANGDKVIDVALRYGYASPTAFQRAFTQFHDITPNQAKKPGARLRAYPPISFQITIKGGIALEYRIEKKGPLRIIGHYEDISMEDGYNFVRIPQMWDEFSPEQYAQLEERAGKTYPGWFGVIDMMKDKPKELRYWIATDSDSIDLEDWMQVQEVPAATYAVFETPLSTLQDMTKQIFGQWFPSSGYVHSMAPEFEYYPQGDMSDSSKYIVELWFPVEKA